MSIIDKKLEIRGTVIGQAELEDTVLMGSKVTKSLLMRIDPSRPRENELMLMDKTPVAIILARLGHKFDEDGEVLQIKDLTGWSVAHEMVAQGHVFALNNLILLQASRYKYTVAHEMAIQGYRFEEDSHFIHLTDRWGVTVAHLMAKKGYRFSPQSNIHQLKIEHGMTVQEIEDEFDLMVSSVC